MFRKRYLSGGQAKLDVNKDGKITGEDFKMLRSKKKTNKKTKMAESPITKMVRKS